MRASSRDWRSANVKNISDARRRNGGLEARAGFAYQRRSARSGDVI
jgi:hypothetical protein